MGDLYNPFPKLPKNIRQIGETDPVVRLYVEDYVNTYLKRLFPTGREALRVGLLLGSAEQCDGTPYIFVDGALELDGAEISGEKVAFSENTWKRAYQRMEESFPKRSIQGWFLCGGQGSQLSPLNYWKQHGKYFAGKNQLMYLNHGLDGEEAVYITSENGFYKLKGHHIYYERNQMMQDYMVTRRDARRVESGANEKVVRDFRERMLEKREQAMARRSAGGVLGVVCGVLSVAVLAGGVVLMNNYSKMRQMESVLASVLPAGVSGWTEYLKGQEDEENLVIEEAAGNVYPTETMAENGQAGAAGNGETVRAGEGQGGGSENRSAGDAEGVSGAEGSEESAGTAGTGQSGAEGGQAGSGSGQGGTEAGQGGAGSGQSVAAGSSQDSSGNGQASTESGQGNAESGISAGQGGNKTVSADLSAEEKSAQAAEPDTAAAQADAAAESQAPVDYAAAAAKGLRIYEVGEGETLYGICWSVYGNLKKLPEVCEQNHLSDVDHILAGQKLILP